LARGTLRAGFRQDQQPPVKSSQADGDCSIISQMQHSQDSMRRCPETLKRQ
jgi:hypothetical protein